MSRPTLTSPLRIGTLSLPNRVLLAPLAGIGNWFVRLQARRHGAGMAFSEMVSSLALAHGNRRTHEEMLRIHPEEHPVAVQLFGPDPQAMRTAAGMVAAAGADAIDINMGCPVRKVLKTGAGAALLADPERALAMARAAGEGSGLPVTVKLRSGLEPGDRSGCELAVRMAAEAGVAAISFHPRPAAVHHSGRPDLELARELVEALEARGLECPVILSGGLRSPAHVHAAYERSGADAVMLARGSLGNPWLFEQVLGGRAEPPTLDEVIAELEWVLDGAEEHWGAVRAARNLRKLYPWYLDRLGVTGRDADAFQRLESLEAVRARLRGLREPVAVP